MSAGSATSTQGKAFAFALFSLVFLIVAISTGRFHVRGDAAQMCAAASSIADHGWVDLPPIHTDLHMAPDGRRYTKYPLANILQCGAGLAFKTLGGWIGGQDSEIQWLFAGIFPAIWTALLALGFFFLARELGFSLNIAAVAALALIFASPIWAYGREMYSENTQAMALTWTMWAYVKARRLGTRRHYFLGGMLVGLCVHSKLPLAVMGFATGVYVIASRPDKKHITRFLLYGFLGFLPFLLAFLAYNWIRYESFFEVGYNSGRDAALGFATPMLSGLHGLLFSPGKSIFVYAPVLVVLPIGVVLAWRRHKEVVLYAAIPVVFTFLTMAKWWSGLGDWGWGPRLVVPMYPFLFLSVLYVMRREHWSWRGTIGVLIALGVFVNFLGIVVDHSHYLWITNVTHGGMRLHYAPGLVRDDLVIVHFIPEFSPPVGHYWLFDRWLGGDPWIEGSWYPWESLGIRGWRPTQDPTPPSLNSWSNGSTAAWQIIGAGWTLITFVLAWLLWLGRRHNKRTRSLNEG
jgi:hypothetical protein